jgi:LysR family transcriptional regulator, glycine cleavage system transcriptional activator
VARARGRAPDRLAPDRGRLTECGTAPARPRAGREPAALADEPLLGNAKVWESWFALAGLRCRVNPVASFNDAGLMLQAAEQDLGLALARELLVADALRDGRLMRLSTLAVSKDQAYALWFVYPSGLRDWPPLGALRDWLIEELKRSEMELRAPPLPLTAQPASAAPARRSRARRPAA